MQFEVVRVLVGFEASKHKSQTDRGTNTFGGSSPHLEIVRFFVVFCHGKPLASSFVVAGRFPGFRVVRQ